MLLNKYSNIKKEMVFISKGGIYGLLVNNKTYVGYTNNFRRRNNEHMSALKRGIHYSKQLQEDYNIDKNIKFKVFENIENPTKEILEQREVYWINKLNTFDSEDGYNLTTGGNGNKKVSKETIIKMRESQLGKKHSEEHNRNSSLARMGCKLSKETIEKLKAMARKGEDNVNSKLSNNEVIVIKNILKDFPNISQAVIAKIFKVGNCVLSNISNDNTWIIINDIKLRTDDLKELYSSKSKECINLNNATRDNVRGENSVLATLTENEAREIKHLLILGELEQQEIASIYGVKRSAITAINRNVNWKYVIVDG